MFEQIDKEVPFYSNTPDDTHCFQAALRMVMKYCWPHRDYSWTELDKITKKVEGLWTWPTAGVIWLQDRRMEIKIIDVFDRVQFIEKGESYLISEYGEEVGKLQIQNSDIEHERNLFRNFAGKVRSECRTPTIQDIRLLLEEDYLVICNVNSSALNKKEGYNGHFVVVTGIGGDYLTVHDPGLPAAQKRQVYFSSFEQAWAYPNDKAKNILAFRWSRRPSSRANSK